MTMVIYYRRSDLLSVEFFPKHLLRQNFPSKGKLGEFSLRGKMFPLARENLPQAIFCLKRCNGLVWLGPLGSIQRVEGRH